MSLVDDELERRVTERLAGLDDMTFERRAAVAPRRRSAAGTVLVAAMCAVAIVAAVGLVVSRGQLNRKAPVTTTPAPAVDPVAHLPALKPGALRGVMWVTSGSCLRGSIDLATLQQSTITSDVCVAPGADRGILVPALRAPVLRVVDPSGRAVGSISTHGYSAIYVTHDGVVVCKQVGRRGRLRLFDGGTVPLSSCPQANDNLQFGQLRFVSAFADQPAIDPRRDAVVAAAVRLTPHLAAIGSDLYRDGQLFDSFDPPIGQVLSASDDGRVVLVSDALYTHLFVYRDGVRRAIDSDIATTGGMVSPDGRRLLLPHGPKVVVVLDAATLRPLARLDLQREFPLVANADHLSSS
jgi:hypothetical protein